MLKLLHIRVRMHVPGNNGIFRIFEPGLTGSVEHADHPVLVTAFNPVKFVNE
jgi:hypothetical protein